MVLDFSRTYYNILIEFTNGTRRIGTDPNNLYRSTHLMPFLLEVYGRQIISRLDHIWIQGYTPTLNIIGFPRYY